MTNAALARRPDFPPLGSVPKSTAGIAATTALSKHGPTRQSLVDDPDKNAPDPDAASTTSVMQVIVTYIPTEVITLYVAFIGVLGHPAETISATGVVTTGTTFFASWIALAVFLFATPLGVWMSFATKLKAMQKPLPFGWSQWPVWEMTAASIAFVAWAFALPSTPFTYYSWYSSGVAGFVVLAVTTILGVVAPLFQKPLTA